MMTSLSFVRFTASSIASRRLPWWRVATWWRRQTLKKSYFLFGFVFSSVYLSLSLEISTSFRFAASREAIGHKTTLVLVRFNPATVRGWALSGTEHSGTEVRVPVATPWLVSYIHTYLLTSLTRTREIYKRQTREQFDDIDIDK